VPDSVVSVGLPFTVPKVTRMVDVPSDAGTHVMFSVPVVGFAVFGGDASEAQLAFEIFADKVTAPLVTSLLHPPSLPLLTVMSLDERLVGELWQARVRTWPAHSSFCMPFHSRHPPVKRSDRSAPPWLRRPELL